jgi:hypothetical protein
MAKKSERQRQAAAQKKKEKAEERRKRALKSAHGKTFEGQIERLSALSKHSGEIVKLLLEGLDPGAVASSIGIEVQEVDGVLAAFNKLPSQLQDLMTRYPQALKNGMLIPAVRVASRLVRRGVHGGADFSDDAYQRLHEILSQGRNPS